MERAIEIADYEKRHRPVAGEGGTARPLPPRQQPHEQAIALAFTALHARRLTDERLSLLGAERRSGSIFIPVLQHRIRVDPDAREVFIDEDGIARRSWALLALHYLCADEVGEDTREVTFPRFLDARGYAMVFQKRIIARLLATVGRSAALFSQRSEALPGERREGTGLGYRFNVLPRVPISIIRHDADEEFGAEATVLYRADAEWLLPAEDRVVAAELLLDALAGKPFDMRSMV